MLIEKVKSKYDIGTVVNFKLISGDEIVGELISQGNGVYEVKKPCIVVTSKDGLGLIQAMFGLDPSHENLMYRDEHVITMCKTHEKMVEHYFNVTAEQPDNLETTEET